jgi:hypothetical protein
MDFGASRKQAPLVGEMWWNTAEPKVVSIESQISDPSDVARAQAASRPVEAFDVFAIRD